MTHSHPLGMWHTQCCVLELMRSVAMLIYLGMLNSYLVDLRIQRALGCSTHPSYLLVDFIRRLLST